MDKVNLILPAFHADRANIHYGIDIDYLRGTLFTLIKFVDIVLNAFRQENHLTTIKKPVKCDIPFFQFS